MIKLQKPTQIFFVKFVKLQLYSKEIPHIYFFVKFVKLLRTPILKNVCEPLLQNFILEKATLAN